MPASCVASPLCTWLVAACMSVACEKDLSIRRSSAFPYSERLSRRARRKKRADGCPRDLMSTFCGSSLQGLMSSCLAFEPCEEYYSSKGSSLFGEVGFSLFGSKVGPTRRERRMNRVGAAGKAMNVALQPAKEVSAKKRPLTRRRRVVVTGMGVVTPVGHELDVFYNSLLEGVSGISEIEAFDCAHFPTVHFTTHLYYNRFAYELLGPSMHQDVCLADIPVLGSADASVIQAVYLMCPTMDVTLRH